MFLIMMIKMYKFNKEIKEIDINKLSLKCFLRNLILFDLIDRLIVKKYHIDDEIKDILIRKWGNYEDKLQNEKDPYVLQIIKRTDVFKFFYNLNKNNTPDIYYNMFVNNNDEICKYLIDEFYDKEKKEWIINSGWYYIMSNKKFVKFNNIVNVILIPDKNNLQPYKHLLWWDNSDYVEFNKSALFDIQMLIFRYPHLNTHVAKELLYFTNL